MPTPDPDTEPQLVHYEIFYHDNDDALEKALRTGTTCIFFYRIWTSQREEDFVTSMLHVRQLGCYEPDGHRAIELLSDDGRFRFRGRCKPSAYLPGANPDGCGRFSREKLLPPSEPRPPVQCITHGEFMGLTP